MKRLTIIRHAKSSWKEPGLDDFDRPLNERGERDAPRMGRRLAAKSPPPDHIVTSPAVRALATARIMAAEVGYEPSDIEVVPSLYLADPQSLLSTIRAFDDAWQRVFLFGHNPGVSELVELLARSQLEDLPTAGVAELELEVESWRQAGPGRARLLDVDFPKLDSRK